MSLDSDVALLGTGVAPLVAANHFLSRGFSVLVLNPDWDFFLEDSELPIDPIGTLNVERLKANTAERAFADLQPSFPGSMEFWMGGKDGYRTGGYHDPSAPHLRQRGRLWMASKPGTPEWTMMEDFYVEASDSDLHPQILEGVQAAARFPGAAGKHQDLRALWIPRSFDVDVPRFRNGLLEFVRERLGPDRVICSVSQVEPIPEGVRFYSQGNPRTARLRHGMLVFWTPRLTQWVLTQAKQAGSVPVAPKGVRLWEQWSLVSREPLDSEAIATFGGMSVWSEAEGGLCNQAGDQGRYRLAVLRPGPLRSIEAPLSSEEPAWVSDDSFAALSSLCNGLLKWDYFSVRAMRPRTLFEWDPVRASEPFWELMRPKPWIRVVNACEGSLLDTVRRAGTVCERIESGAS